MKFAVFKKTYFEEHLRTTSVYIDYMGPCQTPMMFLFSKIVNAKNSIKDICQEPNMDYVFESSKELAFL